MIKEYFSYKTVDSTILIEDSQIKSYKNQNITDKSVRVFDEKKMIFAMSAAKGNVPDAELENKAIDLLSLNMPYDFEHERELTATFTKDKLSITDLEGFTQKILSDLSDVSKHFVLSGRSMIRKSELNLKNNLNLDLHCQKQSIGSSLSMKLKGSGNIMDSQAWIRGFDISDEVYADFLKDTDFLARACLADEVKLENKRYKVLCPDYLLLGKFMDDISGVEYEEKTSLLSGKLSEQIFHESVDIYECRVDDEQASFTPFDHDGIITVRDQALVKNGVLKTIVYDKKRAKKYGKEATGNGYRQYNSTRTNIYLVGLKFKGELSLCSDLISDDVVIIPYISSGGDFLPNGNFSLPTQMAFVFQNGKFIGKAPQITLTGNYLECMNKDFIAIGKNDILKNALPNSLIMTSATINVN
jgi:PmbA protein